MRHRSKESILQILVDQPWWASVVVAAIAYLAIGFALPMALSGRTLGDALGQAARQYAWIFGAFFLIPAPFAALRQYRRRKLLDSQADIESIRNLSWEQFEKLVAEWFHRMGYTVIEQGGASADGGIDLVATGPGETILVQCKHWRSRMVGVSVVRELFGVMTSERATGGALVTTGSFSPDAVAFAAGKPIQLLDGRKLEKLVLSVGGPAPAGSKPRDSIATFNCPECGSPMVERTAKKGKNAGSSFWGCKRYPACRGTRAAA